MGTAAARALASRGRGAILLERRAIGHAEGSSGGPTRNFRLTYHDPVYVRMARRALGAWRRLEADAGEELFGWWAGSTSATSRTRPPPRSRRPASVSSARRPPTWPSGGPRCGSRRGRGSCTSRRARSCARTRRPRRRRDRRGRGRAPVGGHAGRTAAIDDDGVEVATDGGGAVRAPAAIVAAGAWTAPLLREVGIDLPLQPTLEQSTYFTTDPDVGAIPTAIDWDAAPDQPPYIVPNAFVPGEHQGGGPPVGPADRSRCPARAGRGTRGADRRAGAPPDRPGARAHPVRDLPVHRLADEDFVRSTAPARLWWRPRAPVTGSSSRPSSARCWRPGDGRGRPASRSSRFRLDRPALRR